MSDINNSYLAKRTGNLIARYINSGLGNEVISLDGAWGIGKTHFCHAFRDDMLYENYHCIVIDAFKCDFHDDALVAILGSISNAFEENPHDRKLTVERMVQCAVPLLKSVVKGVGKGLSSRYLDSDIIEDEIYKSVLQEGNSLAESIIISEIDNFTKRDDSINALKTLLEEKATSNGKKGLVVIVDELDRCRPLFSLEIIEKIKHVFSCNSVNFILSMNKEQMYSSIRHVYGVTEQDSYIYLNKFITRSFFLSNDAWVYDGKSYQESAIFLMMLDTFKKDLAELESYTTGRGYDYNDAFRAMSLISCYQKNNSRSAISIAEETCKIASFYLQRVDGAVGFLFGIFMCCIYIVKNPKESKIVLKNKNTDKIVKEFNKPLGNYSLFEVPMPRQIDFLGITTPVGELIFEDKIRFESSNDKEIDEIYSKVSRAMNNAKVDLDFKRDVYEGIMFCILNKVQ